MARLRIGTVALRRAESRVIAPFTDRTPPAILRAGVRQGLALFEARLDLFANASEARAIPCVRRARTIAPVLATVRWAKEGGSWKRSERERLALYQALLPHVDAVDVELDAPIRTAVSRAARKARRTLVLSHHDFQKTPSAEKLDAIVVRAAKAHADVIKIAATIQKADDLATLAALFARHPKRPLVVIGMGPRGRATRVLFPALGSLFTFASLDKKTAPGQLGLEETLRAIEKYVLA